MRAPQASVVRPTRWANALLSLIPLSVALALPVLAGLAYPTSTLLGVFGYLAYRLFVVRFWLCRDHRRGVVRLRRGRFEEGLTAFEKSEQVWARRPTLDRFRALFLGSATPWRFAILARYNQGYALSRLGRGQDALDRLGSVLDEEPSMYIARELRDVLLAGSTVDPDIGGAMRDGR